MQTHRFLTYYSLSLRLFQFSTVIKNTNKTEKIFNDATKVTECCFHFCFVSLFKSYEPCSHRHVASADAQ